MDHTNKLNYQDLFFYSWGEISGAIDGFHSEGVVIFEDVELGVEHCGFIKIGYEQSVVLDIVRILTELLK